MHTTSEPCEHPHSSSPRVTRVSRPSSSLEVVKPNDESPSLLNRSQPPCLNQFPSTRCLPSPSSSHTTPKRSSCRCERLFEKRIRTPELHYWNTSNSSTPSNGTISSRTPRFLPKSPTMFNGGNPFGADEKDGSQAGRRYSLLHCWFQVRCSRIHSSNPNLGFATSSDPIPNCFWFHELLQGYQALIPSREPRSRPALWWKH